MCGITGCIIKRGVPESAVLAQAAAQLQHRGPDDQGVHIAGPVGLGHTRLSVIDLAGGHQPICSLDGRYALVANGEIYNHVELRAALQGLGCVFQTESDSEAILHAWDRSALDGVRQLHGMFAFALHDMAAGELVLGRDRLGIKPLFYAVLPDRVVFGSEIKALLPLMPARPGICPEALLQFLQNQFSSGRDTVFTPTRGLNGRLEYRNYDESWGSDFDFDHFGASLHHHTPFGQYSSLGLRLDGEAVWQGGSGVLVSVTLPEDPRTGEGKAAAQNAI